MRETICETIYKEDGLADFFHHYTAFQKEGAIKQIIVFTVIDKLLGK